MTESISLTIFFIIFLPPGSYFIEPAEGFEWIIFCIFCNIVHLCTKTDNLNEILGFSKSKNATVLILGNLKSGRSLAVSRAYQININTFKSKKTSVCEA
ncbi:hypothetical protein HOLDEFILI_01488 [Holdemania filiformis DSM 12042]|uniref:Uncharacterized protein n=1 Tax=Holdemania filiformis DSM 12042 TaxID=545696 RepID=B9Y6P6_9FIRM|nr:hypothetical protein HOLDEFILI_01488 [Holdemania filiformis DSM 12042]